MARVIVVEDNHSILQLLCFVLEAEGHEVVGIEHPMLVFGLSSSGQPDVLLLDLMLPEIGGIALAERLKSHGCVDTPIVAMSSSREMLQAARATGLFHNTIEKPFDVAALLQQVDHCIKGKQPPTDDVLPLPEALP